MGAQLLNSYFVSEIYRLACPEPAVAFCFWFTMRVRNVSVNGEVSSSFPPAPTGSHPPSFQGLFNDSFEMVFIHLAVFLLLRKKMSRALLSFSVAASIKMSALLYAPGALLVFLKEMGPLGTARAAIPAVVFQIAVAFPFLQQYPAEYLSRSFEFTRKFPWFLSHNWKFLPEETFDSSVFHVALLVSHVLVLLVFAYRKGWVRGRDLSEPSEIVFCILACNLIGVTFARSLHFSFYLWYFYSLPFLLVHQAGRFRLWHPFFLVAIEICWNQWKKHSASDLLNTCANWKASLGLTCCHFILLAYLLTQTQGAKAGPPLPTSAKQS